MTTTTTPAEAKPPATKRAGLLTVQDLAELLHAHPRTIRRWAAERRIAHVRFGKAILFTRQQVKDALDAHTVEPVERVDVDAPNPLFDPDTPTVVPMLRAAARR